MTTSAKNPWVLDTEIYRNYLLIGFKNIVTGRVISREVEGEKSQLSVEDAAFLQHFMRMQLTVGFNSDDFDKAIIYAAIEGLTVSEIKDIADEIIIDDKKYWDVAKDWGFTIPRKLDHIDLIEVAPGKASLKIYNGRLHGKRMQDLPIEPTARLTEDEVEDTYTYWKNDLSATELLFTSLKQQLDLRISMSEEYGIDLRSKSDAQIAEAVIKHEIEKVTGYAPVKPTKRPNKFYYRIPKYIRFKSAQMNDILDQLEDTPIRVSPSGKVLMPDFLSEAKIKFGDGIYRMGIGGLHSTESCQHVSATGEYLLFDRDVASFYPRIIINLELVPEHLGWAFLKVYKSIVARRLREKDLAGETKKFRDSLEKGSPEWEATNATYNIHQTNAETLKIVINGSFGKFGSPYSILYSPDLLIQTTITGQLSLLMLIERIHEERIVIASANTDGIVIRCHVDDRDLLNDVVKEWERNTGFDTDETEYAHVYSRDVNNYIAVKPDGSVKTKGAFAIAEAGKPPLMNKNPTNEICVEAVINYLTKGQSLTKTIRECEDITKFLTVRTVQGGAIWGVPLATPPDDASDSVVGDFEPGAEYLGKAIRWYYGRGLTKHIHYKKPNQKGNHNKVPKSEGAQPVMTLPDEFPDDIDFGWYIREAQSILKDIGAHDDLVGKVVRKKKVVA